MIKLYTFLILIAVLLSCGLGAQTTDVPTGRWQTIDDETGETKSIVEIYEQDDKYFGRIVELMNDKDALCTECSGKRADQPIQGMLIIENLEADDEFWSGGTILDPKKGATYKLSAWYENNKPDKLFIRGKHWTGIYRTQTWVRE